MEGLNDQTGTFNVTEIYHFYFLKGSIFLVRKGEQDQGKIGAKRIHIGDHWA